MREPDFRTLVEYSTDMISKQDASGMYTYVSPSCQTLLGYSPEELVGKSVYDFCHPADLSELRANLDHGLSSDDTLTISYRIRRRSGEYVWFETTSRKIRENEIMSSSRDLSQRKRAERMMYEHDSLLHAFFMTSPQLLGIVEITDDDDILHLSCNIATARFHRTTPQGMQGRRATELHGTTAKGVKDLVALYRRCESSGPTNFEYEHLNPDGTHWFSMTLCYLGKGPEGRPRFTFTVADITQQKLAEAKIIEAERERSRLREHAALEASRLKSEFIANISHEVRTPINGVMGMANLLLDTPLDESQRDFAETILSSGDSLLRIVNDILDLSKIEAGKVELERIDFDLHETMQETIKFFRPQAVEKNLVVDLEISPDIPRFHKGDPGRIRQVLMNLLSNAIKFTPAGCVELRVFTVETGIRFEVRDTGVGIMRDACEHVFQPFFQVDSSTTRRFGGTGLGLSISHKLVEMMCGRIGVASRFGEGSCFWFELKLEPGSEPIRPAPQPPVSRKVTDSVRVLVAEDNKINQVVALRILEKLGYRADAVLNGTEALQAIARVQYDVILMDCQMPGMDGFEATRKLREAGNTVPIIALTAGAMLSDQEKCLEAGMNAFVTKPISVTLLDEKIRSMLPSQSDTQRMDESVTEC